VDLTKHRFSQTHEWVHGDDARVRIGITDYAQGQLGDVIFVELPAAGAEVAEGAKFGVIESVKAASDLYSPVAGKVVGVNGALQSAPELINNDPFGDGWMLEVELTQPVSSELLDESAYQKFVEGL
jgi:glycine cleavage system H protein